MGKLKRFKEINLIIDTVNDSMWSALCASIFQRYVGKLAIHVGSNLRGQHRDEWLTSINKFPWATETSLEGKPKWKPNAYIVDLGRRIDPVRIRRYKGVPAVVCFADDHQHHFGGNKRIGDSFVKYSRSFDRVYLRQYCALPFYDQRKVVWFPHNTWSHATCRNCSHLSKPKITHDIVFPGRIVGVHKNIYAKGDVYGARRMKMVQSLLRYNIHYSQNKVDQCQYTRMMHTGKIVFNCTGTPYDMNKRVFEGLEAKGMLLTNDNSYNSGLLKLFKHKEHLVAYKNEEELHHYVQYYLEHDDEREAIAKAGRKEALKHNEESRVLQILADLYNLI